MSTRFTGERIAESVKGLILWSIIVFFGMGGRLWKKYFQHQGEPWRALLVLPAEKHSKEDGRSGLRVRRHEVASPQGWAATERSRPHG